MPNIKYPNLIPAIIGLVLVIAGATIVSNSVRKLAPTETAPIDTKKLSQGSQIKVDNEAIVDNQVPTGEHQVTIEQPATETAGQVSEGKLPITFNVAVNDQKDLERLTTIAQNQPSGASLGEVAATDPSQIFTDGEGNQHLITTSAGKISIIPIAKKGQLPAFKIPQLISTEEQKKLQEQQAIKQTKTIVEKQPAKSQETIEKEKAAQQQTTEEAKKATQPAEEAKKEKNLAEKTQDAVKKIINSIPTPKPNQAPTINPLPVQEITEETVLVLAIGALDPENDPITLTASGLPNNASFRDSGNGTATLHWATNLRDGNTFSLLANNPKFREYNVIISASDDKSANTKAIITIKVSNKNQLPAIKITGPQTVRENQIIKLDIDATDADFDDLTFVAQDLPKGAQLDGRKGKFEWTPGFDQQGEHRFKLGATDGIGDPSFVDFIINVHNQNRSPKFELAGQIDIIEEQTINLNVAAVDPDNDEIILTADNLPKWLELKDKQLTGTPQINDYGTYQAKLTATDSSGASASASLVIKVLAESDANHPPIFETLNAVTIFEEETLNLNIKAGDLENDSITMTATALPPAANFTTDQAGSAQLNWIPPLNLLTNNNQITQYHLKFTATDSKNAQSTTELLITVKNKNQAPVLETIAEQTLTENEVLRFDLIASDPDRDEVTITAEGLPSNAQFNSKTGQLFWQPNYDQAGAYKVNFTATDAYGATAQQQTMITVADVNRAPILLISDQFHGTEKIPMVIELVATDPDNQPVTITAEDLPFWLEQDANKLIGTPPRSEAGIHRFKITAVDELGATAQQEVTLVIQQAANHAPFFEPLDTNYQVAEDEALIVEIGTQDQDEEDLLILEGQDLPRQAIFTDLGNGKGQFSWVPPLDTLGRNGESIEQKVTFIVQDDRGLKAKETMIIKVTNTNQPPQLALTADQEVSENNSLNFKLACTDADQDSIFYQASNLPVGATLDYQTGEFIWTPGFDDAGEYSVQAFCTDQILDSELTTVKINVANTNRKPVITTDSDAVGTEKDGLAINITADDEDGDNLTFTSQNLPDWLTLEDNQLFGIPTEGSAGNYQTTVQASDGTDTAERVINITINPAAKENHAPVFEPISDTTIEEKQEVVIEVIVTDPDDDPITLTTQDLPEGALFTDKGKGKGEFKWTPSLDAVATNVDFKTQNLRFIARDDKDLTTETIIILSVENKNQNPVIAEIGDQALAENQAFELKLQAFDPDQDEIFYNAEDIPDGAVFDYETGMFSWTPTFEQAGEYNLKFSASDVFDGKSEKEVKLSVANINRTPILDVATTANGIEEKEFTAIKISATDPDNEELTITIQDLPTWLNYSVASGEITGTIPAQSAGEYTFKVFVADPAGAVTSSEIKLTIAAAIPKEEGGGTILPDNDQTKPPPQEELVTTLEINLTKLNSEELGDAFVTNSQLNIEETQAQALVSFFNVGGQDFAVVDTAGNVTNLDVNSATADEKLTVIYTLTKGVVERRDRNGNVLEQLPFENIPEDANGLRTNAEGTLLAWYGPSPDRKQVIVYFSWQEGDSWRLTQSTVDQLLSSEFKFNTTAKQVAFTELRDDQAKVSILNIGGALNQTNIEVTGDYWQLVSNGDIWLLKLIEENLELGISQYAFEHWTTSSTLANKTVTFSEPIFAEIGSFSIDEVKNLVTLIIGAEVQQISLE